MTTVGCTNAERVHFDAHQLDGPATAWWENFTATYPIDTITWDQFQQAFRTAHVSAGAMAMKKREFRNLRQGGRTVGQYVDDFSKLAAWWENFTATYPIDTITWDQFQQAFRTAHVSAGAMAMKKREFRNLRQGGRTVGQYVDDFSKLARYAPDDVATWLVCGGI